MPKLNDSTRRLKRALYWSASFIWNADRKNIVVVTAVSLINGFFSPLLIVVTAYILDLAKSNLTDSTTVAVDLWPWLLLVGGMALFATVTGALRGYCQARLEENVGLRARRTLLEHASQISLAALEQPKVKDQLMAVGGEPGGAMVKSVTGLVSLVSSVIRIVGLAAIMLYINPLWTVLAIAASIPVVAIGGWLSILSHRLHLRTTKTRRLSGYYGSQLLGFYQAASIRVLGLADLMMEREAVHKRALLRETRRFERLSIAVSAGAATFTLAILLLAILAVMRSAQQGALDFYSFLAFWGAAWRFSKDVPKVSGSFSRVSKAWLTVDYFQQFLQDHKSEKTVPLRSPLPLQGEIVVDHLSFRYPDAQRDALCDVSLRIEPGETVAIVGHNGAGKTTLAKLIAGIYTPASGDIFYDGVAHGVVDFSQLYQRMAVLFQNTYIFEASARENIAMGDWQRLSDAQAPIEQIASRLGVDEMIRSFPNGYETHLGKGFGNHELSGGQWRKLAIARALACDPAIVLLDEPTAGLDIYAEADLHRCMQRLVHDRTAVIISHRFTTVMDADRIIVMDDGRIVEQGSHLQLLAKGGYYSAMYKSHDRPAAKRAA